MSIRVSASLRDARLREGQLLSRVSQLELELASVREDLLRQQGAVFALEGLLTDRDRGSIRSGSSPVVSELGRSPRSTKEEMQNRRQVVARILFQKGSCTANELLPFVCDELGYELKIHHLRNVLKKYTSDFIKGEDHGVWQLSESAKDFYSIEFEWDSEESESSETL